MTIALGERILFVVAMEAEAQPIRASLGLTGAEATQLHPDFPAMITIGDGPRPRAVATNGTDSRFGVDAIASQPAVVTTLTAIEVFEPTLVISAGAAGGFDKRGGAIGEVVLSDRVVFHDRRVQIPGFDRYGRGDYPVADLSAIAIDLGLTIGTASTGNALDAPQVDLDGMDETQTLAKDMEAAAVAWVCEHKRVPFVALKAITDLVDVPEPTGEQFARNLAVATKNLATTAAQLTAALG